MNFMTKFIQGHTKQTHAVLVGLLGLAGASQLPFGQSILHHLTEEHPRLTPLLTMLVSAGFLLLNPSVDAKIKSVTGIDLAADEAKLQQSQQNIRQVQQDLKQAGAQGAQAMNTAPPAAPMPPVKTK